MSEYIERDAVTAMLKRECSPRVMAYLVDELCKLPAADVVSHEWVIEHMSGDYISREKAIENVLDQMKHSTSENAMRERLLNLVAADVRPVVKSHWVDNRVAFYRGCPECGAFVRANLDEVFLRDFPSAVGKLNFCPNCGADMREES